jgi:hypothetical protein
VEIASGSYSQAGLAGKAGIEGRAGSASAAVRALTSAWPFREAAESPQQRTIFSYCRAREVRFELPMRPIQHQELCSRNMAGAKTSRSMKELSLDVSPRRRVRQFPQPFPTSIPVAATTSPGGICRYWKPLSIYRHIWLQRGRRLASIPPGTEVSGVTGRAFPLSFTTDSDLIIEPLRRG